MTVVHYTEGNGRIDKIATEIKTGDPDLVVSFVGKEGKMLSDLNIGADVPGAKELTANIGIAYKGFELGSQGFLIEKQVGDIWLSELPNLTSILHPYMNGADLVKGRWERYVIDFFGMTEQQAFNFGVAYQRVFDTVKAERVVNREERTAKKWWVFRRSGETIRNAISGLHRFIGTTRTAKHRVFQFLPSSYIAESKIVIIASSDAFCHGVLSSTIHLTWSEAAGGFLGVGNDPTYNHLDCFNKFPFPTCNENQKEIIRSIAEALDSHRKQRQTLHPTLTITDMYNVLEKMRSGEMLNTKEQKVHEQGLVSVLMKLHDDLDIAVATSFGWPANLSEEEILERLVALNKERAAEEACGLVRWLRPEYQNPQGVQQADMGMEANAVEAVAVPQELQEWPKALADQAQAVQRALQQQEHPISAEQLAQFFKGATKGAKSQRVAQIDSLLQTLNGLGLIRKTERGQYVK